jgi:hypothetical protein
MIALDITAMAISQRLEDGRMAAEFAIVRSPR